VGIAAELGVRQLPAAGQPEWVQPDWIQRFAQPNLILFCGGVGGADAPATAQAH
jgi:hypothetical protein